MNDEPDIEYEAAPIVTELSGNEAQADAATFAGACALLRLYTSKAYLAQSMSLFGQLCDAFEQWPQARRRLGPQGATPTDKTCRAGKRPSAGTWSRYPPQLGRGSPHAKKAFLDFPHDWRSFRLVPAQIDDRFPDIALHKKLEQIGSVPVGSAPPNRVGRQDRDPATSEETHPRGRGAEADHVRIGVCQIDCAPCEQPDHTRRHEEHPGKARDDAREEKGRPCPAQL